MCQKSNCRLPHQSCMIKIKIVTLNLTLVDQFYWLLISNSSPWWRSCRRAWRQRTPSEHFSICTRRKAAATDDTALTVAVVEEPCTTPASASLPKQGDAVAPTIWTPQWCSCTQNHYGIGHRKYKKLCTGAKVIIQSFDFLHFKQMVYFLESLHY